MSVSRIGSRADSTRSWTRSSPFCATQQATSDSTTSTSLRVAASSATSRHPRLRSRFSSPASCRCQLPQQQTHRGLTSTLQTPINDKTNVCVVIPGGRLSNWNTDNLDGSDPFQELIYLSTQLFIKGKGGEEVAEKIMHQAAHDPKLVIKYPIKKSIPELEEPDIMTVVTDMMYKTTDPYDLSASVLLPQSVTFAAKA
ncbi:hypothetical protein EXIGLDRAFT_707038 [Exidia glandulosa HHB12029]|uniref:Uncharacterized protein n=1 Tax=Exidia glandulosa HHB12029 TaxID=1314781 RepID=A0A165AWD9_EXIGL|nr:hypothetical protein EXIGLDRAFT_707038 [Exidia glandulosa HHB12029]